MTERDAFIVGVTRFCKEAGLDVDDTEQMTRLLFMPPFRAQPIIKRAAVKSAWSFFGSDTDIEPSLWGQWSDWVTGTTQHADRIAANRAAVRVGQLGREDNAAIRAQQQQHPDDPMKWTGKTDPAFLQKLDDERQLASDVSHQQTAEGRAGVPAPQLAASEGASVPAGQGTSGINVNDVEKAMPETLKRLGMTADEWKAQANRTQEAQAMRRHAQMLQRQYRRSDPRLIEGLDFSTPFGQRFQKYLEETRGQLGGGRRPHVVGGGEPKPPTAGTDTEPLTSAPDPQASTAAEVAAPQTAAKQMSSSPAADIAPTRAAMSHLMSEPPPGVGPGSPANTAPGSAATGGQTTGTAQGGQPPAVRKPEDSPAEMAAFGSGASDNAFVSHPNIQEALKATERYKRYGGTGSVQVGLPSRAGTLNA